MGTRVIAKKTLTKYAEKYPDAEKSLASWYRAITKATISSLHDVQAVDPRVSLVNGEYLVFDIRGGHYRLITTAYFPASEIYIKLFLTHKEYDLWSDEMRKEKKKKLQ